MEKTDRAIVDAAEWALVSWVPFALITHVEATIRQRT